MSSARPVGRITVSYSMLDAICAAPPECVIEVTGPPIRRSEAKDKPADLAAEGSVGRERAVYDLRPVSVHDRDLYRRRRGRHNQAAARYEPRERMLARPP